MKEPTIQQRVGAALFIVAFGVENTGVMTVRRLMWPNTDNYTNDDVKRVAARLLASVHTALLEAVPQARIEQILKDQAAYLSFAVGDGWPDEKIESQEAE